MSLLDTVCFIGAKRPPRCGFVQSTGSASRANKQESHDYCSVLRDVFLSLLGDKRQHLGPVC